VALSDCLWLLPITDGQGDVRLKRNGTIQVLQRFDGRESQWPPTDWDTYFRADPRNFLQLLEAEAGLPAPMTVPSSLTATDGVSPLPSRSQNRTWPRAG